MVRGSLAVAVLVVVGACAGAHRTSTQSARPSVVAGIPLVGASSAVRRDCQSAADWLGYAVPCPQVLPLGSQPTPLPCVVTDCRRFIAPGTFTAAGVRWAFGSVDFPTSLRVGHLVIQASPLPEDVAPFIYGKPVSGITGVVHVVRTLRVGSRDYKVVLVPHAGGSAFAGHTVLVWTARGHTYGLGFHQHDAGALALDVAVVRSLVLVGPTPGVTHPTPWEIAPASIGLRSSHSLGQRLVAGVELASAPSAEDADCRRAALKVGFPVPCLALLPVGSRPSRALCMSFDWTAYETAGCGALATWATGSIDFPIPHAPAGRVFLLAAVGALTPRRLLSEAVRLLQPQRPRRESVTVLGGHPWVVVSRSTGGPFGDATFLVWQHRVTGPLGGTYTYGLGMHGRGTTIQALLAALRKHTRILNGP